MPMLPATSAPGLRPRTDIGLLSRDPRSLESLLALSRRLRDPSLSTQSPGTGGTSPGTGAGSTTYSGGMSPLGNLATLANLGIGGYGLYRRLFGGSEPLSTSGVVGDQGTEGILDRIRQTPTPPTGIGGLPEITPTPTEPAGGFGGLEGIEGSTTRAGLANLSDLTPFIGSSTPTEVATGFGGLEGIEGSTTRASLGNLSDIASSATFSPGDLELVSTLVSQGVPEEVAMEVVASGFVSSAEMGAAPLGSLGFEGMFATGPGSAAAETGAMGGVGGLSSLAAYVPAAAIAAYVLQGTVKGLGHVFGGDESRDDATRMFPTFLRNWQAGGFREVPFNDPQGNQDYDPIAVLAFRSQMVHDQGGNTDLPYEYLQGIPPDVLARMVERGRWLSGPEAAEISRQAYVAGQGPNVSPETGR